MNQRVEPWIDESGIDFYGHWETFSLIDPQGNKVTQRVRWIESGTFLMGSPENEPCQDSSESPQHTMTLANGFWLFDTVCTQSLWQAVMGNNPSFFEGADRPVENVSWNDCQDFLNRLNKRLPGINLGLPSEAQWEYACRAGSTTRYCFGDDEQSLEDYAWYWDNAAGETHPVGNKQANAWGLYDLHGNVCEWTQDLWHKNYQGAPADGSVWVDNEDDDDNGANRVIRGGSWYDRARSVRAAFRFRLDPGNRDGFLGFRCARVQVS